MLKDYNLPKLHVLVDINLDQKIYEAITRSHCRVFKTDLRIKPISLVSLDIDTNSAYARIVSLLARH